MSTEEQVRKVADEVRDAYAEMAEAAINALKAETEYKARFAEIKAVAADSASNDTKRNALAEQMASEDAECKRLFAEWVAAKAYLGLVEAKVKGADTYAKLLIAINNRPTEPILPE
jgi:hypothetical protein